MNENLRAITLACKTRGLTYRFLDASRNVLLVATEPKSILFVNWATPFNSQAQASLCDYKDCAEQILRGIIRMPRTQQYLDPACKEPYQKYTDLMTLPEIIKDIENSFQHPVIIKSNRGYRGLCVFLCHSNDDVIRAVQRVFDTERADYDFICLAQEYVEHVKEYRVICVAGEVALAYEKDNSQATFFGNLNPLHYSGAVSRKITNEDLLARLTAFCFPLFQDSGIFFCGLDVVEVDDGTFVCIEVNSSPMLHKYIKDNGIEDVVTIYTRAFEYWESMDSERMTVP